MTGETLRQKQINSIMPFLKIKNRYYTKKFEVKLRIMIKQKVRFYRGYVSEKSSKLLECILT